jgi:hypothetical protein
MPRITKSDLRYEYNWKATEGDNPHLIHNDNDHPGRFFASQIHRWA